MSFSIVINQHISSLDLIRAVFKAKIKDPKPIEAAWKGGGNYIKNSRAGFQKKNHMVQMTLNKFTDHFSKT